MSAWIPVCTLAELPLLGARRVERPQGAPVAVFRNADDEVFALLDRCPHKGGPLSQGIVSGRSVACPLHNWNIALDSGQVAAPDEGATPAFAVKVEGGVVHLDRQQLATLAIDLPLPQAGPACRGARAACMPTPQQL
ncbi:nitrite reductase small subunit NirD [Azohydromonas lata]|uniref:Nitrite reductase small subunit NirD n=1 Tax=Azohydromonas lata TaxID=45677 RepID=A0ABU5ICT4_9BURK|nr:nitrite reductase small subunit NirD [Azohydromonas lata]MDZ5456624.1 nitrite reductase small subunit NirD [Azohydromonas lata]